MANLRDISATEVEVNNSICQTIAKYFLRGGGGGGREVIVELTTKVSGGGIKKKGVLNPFTYKSHSYFSSLMLVRIVSDQLIMNTQTDVFLYSNLFLFKIVSVL